jgi:septal ring factor EnvC (AmiA/AmiB activator)
MSQSFFESQVAEHPHTEETASKQPAMNKHNESGTLAVSANEFSALEERVVRTVQLVKSERQARAAAEQRADKLEAQLSEQTPLVTSLQEEVRALNAERDQVRQRVERLLSQLDALEV